MKLYETNFFALADKSILPPGKQSEGFIKISGRKYQASLRSTRIISRINNCPYLSVKACLPRQVRWNERLTVQLENSEPDFELRVVYPEANRLKKQKEEKLVVLLDRFSGSAEQMLLALTDEAGIRGVRQGEILQFCQLKPDELQKLAMNLEKEGQLYILEFSPLFLLSQRSFEFLTQKILNYLQSYHQKRPQELGVPIKKLKDRFSLPKQILLLALNRLAKAGQVVFDEEMAALAGFQTKLSTEEDEVMKAIEKLLLEEKFSSSSFDELVKKFKIHPTRLNTMLDLLLQKKKIVQSKDGFILHSEWLEHLKNQLAEMKRKGKTELTVGEFKKMTGLTRKFAIPLLEFLDELGLTKRLGPKRLIL